MGNLWVLWAAWALSAATVGAIVAGRLTHRLRIAQQVHRDIHSTRLRVDALEQVAGRLTHRLTIAQQVRRDINLDHVSTRLRVDALEQAFERTTNVRLAAELEDVRAALTTMSATNRREYGKLWARLRGDRPAVIDGELEDSALQAMLDLQKAPGAAPK